MDAILLKSVCSIPMFNCYCDTLMFSKDYKEKNLDELKLPMRSNKSKRIYFKKSGIIIDNSKYNYTIINAFKGGVVYHFNKNKNSLEMIVQSESNGIIIYQIN